MKNPALSNLVDRQLTALHIPVGDTISFHCEDAINTEIIHLTKTTEGYQNFGNLLDLAKAGYEIAVLLPSTKNSTDKYLYWLKRGIWEYSSTGRIFTTNNR